MAEEMSKLTVLIPKCLLNGARKAAQVRDTTLAALVHQTLDKMVRRTADEEGMTVDEFCKRSVKLKAGRPRKSE